MPTIKRLCVGDVVLETTRAQEVLVVKLSDSQTLYRVVSKRVKVTGLDVFTQQCVAALSAKGYGKCKLAIVKRANCVLPNIWHVNMYNSRGTVVTACGPTQTAAMRQLVAACGSVSSCKCAVVKN